MDDISSTINAGKAGKVSFNEEFNLASYETSPHSIVASVDELSSPCQASAPAAADAADPEFR